MPENQTSFTFPQILIRRTLEQAVEELYGLPQFQIHVVRQHRALHVGSLDFIDYAVPCFELAKAVRLNALKVAQDLVAELKKRTAADPYLADCQYQAVTGYLNIQLSPPYLEQIIRAAIEWLQGPLPDQTVSEDVFLIAGIGALDQADRLRTERAYRYIHDLYELAGREQRLAYLLDDFSESMLNRFMQHQVASSQDAREQVKLRRQAGAFISSSQASSDVVAEEFRKLQTALTSRQRQLLEKSGIKQYELLTESAVAAKVHQYVDSLQIGTAVVHDPTSHAAYYTHRDEMYALRSATGMLYGISYIFYELEQQLQRARQASARAVIVLTPAKLHSVIVDYWQAISGPENNPRVVCFDSRVSQADILQLQSNIQGVAEHCFKVSQTLQRTQKHWLEHVKKRQSVLALVDLPAALGQAIDNIQLPLLFDVISESVEVLTSLSEPILDAYPD